MDGYTYFKICDDLLDNEVSLYDCKKEIASINNILISIFKLHSNDELINIFRKASKIYDENNRLELRMFMSIFSKYIRNSKKKVYKTIINNKDLVISIGRFDSYTLFDYIILNLELYNNDYKKIIKELNIKKYNKEEIYDLNYIFYNKINIVKNDNEIYKMYIEILRILNNMSPYYYTDKVLKEYENNNPSLMNINQYIENERNINQEEYKKEESNTILSELENKKRILPSPLIKDFDNDFEIINDDFYKKNNFADFLYKIELNCIYINKIGKYNKSLNEIKPLFIKAKNDEIIRYGVMNYSTINGSSFRFKLPFFEKEILEYGSEIHFFVQTKNKKIYYANSIDVFYCEDIENIFTILYDMSLKYLKIYQNEKKVFSKINVYFFEIVDGYKLEYFESVINGSGDYIATCLNLLNMTFDCRIKSIKTKNRYLNNIPNIKTKYKLAVEQSLSLEYLIFLDYIKDQKLKFEINDNTLIVFLESNCDSFFEVISVYFYLYYKSEFNINNIDGIDIKYIFEMNECMRDLDFKKLTYLFIMHGKENYDFLLNLSSFTGLYDLYADTFELLNLLSMDKNNIYFKNTNNDISFSLKKIKRIISDYSDLVKSKGHFVRWKSEYHLYLIVKSFYYDAIYQYRSYFLGQQSLDIYIPSINIGIEYQGIQHFKETDYFGGNLEERIKLDKIKKEKCEKKGIKLIYWNYDYDVSIDNFKKLFIDNNIYIPKDFDTNFLLNWEKKESQIIRGKKIVAQYDMNGKLVKTYNSAKEASEYLSISEVAISHAITGKQISANNSLWRKYKIPEETVLQKIKLPLELLKIKIYMKNGDIVDYENILEASQKLNVKKDVLLRIININKVEGIDNIKKIEIIN